MKRRKGALLFAVILFSMIFPLSVHAAGGSYYKNVQRNYASLTYPTTIFYQEYTSQGYDASGTLTMYYALENLKEKRSMVLYDGYLHGNDNEMQLSSAEEERPEGIGAESIARQASDFYNVPLDVPSHGRWAVMVVKEYTDKECMPEYEIAAKQQDAKLYVGAGELYAVETRRLPNGTYQYTAHYFVEMRADTEAPLATPEEAVVNARIEAAIKMNEGSSLIAPEQVRELIMQAEHEITPVAKAAGGMTYTCMRGPYSQKTDLPSTVYEVRVNHATYEICKERLLLVETYVHTNPDDTDSYYGVYSGHLAGTGMVTKPREWSLRP